MKFLRLDGKSTALSRLAIANKFNEDDDIGCLLLTSRVGSLGLNLTGATVVIFLELDWNPSVDLQAMDRCHRIGQDSVVNVYKIVTKGTVEEKVLKVQMGKDLVKDGVINGENSSVWSLGTEHLLDFFGYEEEDSNELNNNRTTSTISRDDMDDGNGEEDFNFLRKR